MTKPATEQAAFEATYSDWKLIRSRKVVQLVLEVPVEQADKAYQVLGGMPRPDAEIWVAVARLNTDRAALPPPEKGEAPACINAHRSALPPRRFTSLPLPQQAAILCQDARFRHFVADFTATEVLGETEFITWIKIKTGISSRRKLSPDIDGGQWFIRMRDRYLAEKAAA